MTRKKKVYDDDDGRTIADMSGIGSQPMFLPRVPGAQRGRPAEQPGAEPADDRPWEDSSMSREDRRMYILGALKAGLLIALVFIVGLGLLILLLLWLWNR